MSRLIEVKEVIRDKYSLYSLKRFNFSTVTIEKPVRALDVKNIHYEHITTLFRDYPIIFEKSLLVNLNNFCKILETNDNRKIRDHFGFSYYAKDFPRYISITFTFNPLRSFKSLKEAEDHLEGYLLYYQAYSASSLLVPNIKVYRMVSETPRKKIKKAIITIDEFIRVVDTMYSILEYHDNKPVFAPLSLKLSMNDIDKLAEHYMKKEYYNIWIDFEGSAVTEDKIAQIRKFIRKFDERKLFDKLAIIITNIRREIISNIKKDYTPASDVLATIVGANIVGVNREPMRPMEGKVAIGKNELQEHKARIFDSDTYYYLKATIAQQVSQEIKSQVLTNKRSNVAINTKLINDEFNRQSEEFLRDDTVREYISKKKMLQEYKHGSLLKALLYSKYYVERPLTEWF